MAGKPGVIYLQKDKFQLYSPFLGSIAEFRFTPQMVRDLDVLNDELLQEQIKVLVTNGKIAPSSLIIVLADNAYFVKDFALPAQPPVQPVKPGQPQPPQPKISLKDLQPQIETFIEHVPYENVVSKSFPFKNGVRICAVNQDLYKTVQSGFEKLGFSVIGVFPGMALGAGLSAKPTLDGSLVNATIQKSLALKQFDLISQEPFTPASEKKEEEQVDEVEEELANSKEPPKTDKKRLAVMIGVLGILLVVLVIVIVQSMQPPPKQQTLAAQPTVMPPVSTATPVNTVAPLPTAPLQNLTVKIITPNESQTAAQTMKDDLKTSFQNVTIQNQSSLGSANTIVTFAKSMNQDLRNTVLDDVRKVTQNISVQESANPTNDVTIIVGKIN